MRRREVLILLGGAAVTWPMAARAQQPAMPVIGFLNQLTREEYATTLKAFHDGLREQGFVEGRNAAVEYRWAESRITVPTSILVRADEVIE